MKLGISLVTVDFLSMLQGCIESLLASDVMEFAPKLAYWDNGSKEDNVDYVFSKQELDPFIIAASDNHGIVLPRIEVFKALMREGCDAVLEIHADMRFPKEWFRPLAELLEDRAAIVSPMVLGAKLLEDPEELERECALRRGDDVWINRAHMLPWLLNTSLIAKLGYYDRSYHPMRVEDDDLAFRVIHAGLYLVSTNRSVVNHAGGLVRYQLKPPGYINSPGNQVNEDIFRAKHGICPTLWRRTLFPPATENLH